MHTFPCAHLKTSPVAKILQLCIQITGDLWKQVKNEVPKQNLI